MSRTIVINVFGEWNRAHKRRRKPRVFFRLWTGPQSFFNVLAGKEPIMARLTTEDVFEQVTIHPLTAKGRPAPIDGAVIWTSSDEAVATVTSTSDTTARVAAVGPGVCQITAVCDADMDPGEERQITATGPLEVVPAEAQTVEIDFGNPTLAP